MKCAAIPSTIVSVRHGLHARRRTTKDNFFSAAGSKPRPARISMIVSAICLVERERGGERERDRERDRGERDGERRRESVMDRDIEKEMKIMKK